MKRILALIAIALLTPAASAVQLDISDFDWRVPVTVSGYAGTIELTNFPILVKLAADAPSGFDYADCAADGSDLRFADADGNLVPHEIESWDATGTSYVWVKVPILSGTATSLALCYGANPAGLPAVDPADVWSRYVVVIHGGASLTNAVGNGLAVTAGSTSVAANMAAGIAGGGMRKTVYKAIGVNVAEPSPKMANSGQFSVSAWFKRDGCSGKSNNGTHVLMSNRKTWNSDGDGFLLLTETGTRLAISYKGGHTWSTGTNLTSAGFMPGDWGHVAFAYDKPGAKLVSFLNGIQDNEKNSPENLVNTKESVWSFGSYANNTSDDCFKGDMDEIRVFDGFASGDWIQAEHDSVADPASFAVLGPAESTDADVPRIGAVSATAGAGTASFSVALAEPGFGGAVPTAVSVFYGTDGANWTELPLGSTNEVATLTGTATGLPGNAVFVWYAAATSSNGGPDKTAQSPKGTFRTAVLPTPDGHKAFTATVSYQGTSAENVPVLLHLSETAIENFRYADVTASGFEIVDASGNLLPWEIDTWNTNGESLLWVRLPVWQDGETLTVRYGADFPNAPSAAAETWADYVGVWHLNDTNGASAYGSYPNSTAVSGIDGEKASASIADVAGRIGKCVQTCNATKKGTGYQKGGVFVPDSGSDSPIDLRDTFTISGWFKHKNQDYYYDKFFAKRKKVGIDATVPPTGAFAIEAGNDGGTQNVSALGGGSTYTKVNFNSTLRNTWSYLTFVYNGSNLSIYQNGAPCASFAINPATNNDAPLCFGNMSGGYGAGTGDCAWCGWIDEVRLSDATPSAAWIAAEYAAMADASAISYSRAATVDAASPQLAVPTIARNDDGSFTVSVVVSENVPASVACLVDGDSVPMATVGAALPMTYSAVLTNLADGTYTATARAVSTSGYEVLVGCPTAFHSGALAITKTSDADEGAMTSGGFRISRLDADPTDLPELTFDVAFSGDGLAAVVAPGISTATIPAGATYVDISVTPVFTTDVDADADLVLTVSGTNIGMPSTGTLTVINASFDPAVRYVATTGDDANHGGTPELPKKTIAAAVNSLRTVAQTQTCTVHVAPGLYPNSQPQIVVTNAIRVVGDDPDPSRTVVSNRQTTGWDHKNQRCFYVNHADAVIANLTMQKGGVTDQKSGGNFYVGSAGGMVSNCVVEAGDTLLNSYAGGGCLDGGLVTHTVFRKNKSGCDGGSWQGSSRSGVLVLKGSSRAENCLFVNNRQDHAVVLIQLEGSSVLRNCTVADTALTKTNDYCKSFAALNIASGATVQNVVIAGVTNTLDGATCTAAVGTASRFLNGAFDGNASALPAGTVTGTAAEFFRNYASSDYKLKYQPKSGGPLYNAGAEYPQMAAFDLTGVQPRKVSGHVDIGCYEGNAAGTMLLIK